MPGRLLAERDPRTLQRRMQQLHLGDPARRLHACRNLAWAERIEQLCDWIGIEGDWATPTRSKAKYVLGPVVTALDADVWRPDLPVPEAYRIAKAPDEVLVYHAVANYAERRKAGRDIKGTGAVFSAIEQLQAEGLPVKLFFAHDVPSRDVRFYQGQADIVIDQLNYGRYGANARENMMLGRPVLVRLDPTQSGALPPSRPILEAPMVDASEFDGRRCSPRARARSCAACRSGPARAEFRHSVARQRSLCRTLRERGRPIARRPDAGCARTVSGTGCRRADRLSGDRVQSRFLQLRTADERHSPVSADCEAQMGDEELAAVRTVLESGLVDPGPLGQETSSRLSRQGMRSSTPSR